MDLLSPSERKVAEYILKHPDKVVHLSVAKLAENSGSSQAAIIRLCNRLDMYGYQELKVRIAVDLQEDEAPIYQEITSQDNVESIIKKISYNNIHSIRDTLKILDVGHVKAAIAALINAEKIYFYGIGASGLIAQDAQQKFMRIRKASFAFADVHMQLTSAALVTPRDAVVGISYSGETPEIIRVVQIAKDNGATIISISKLGQTALSKVSDILLNVSSTENEIRSGPTASRITQLNVIDILYLGVAAHNYDEYLDYLEKTRRTVRAEQTLDPG